MHVEAIPMRWGSGDNYCYLVSDSASKDACIIDPAEPEEVKTYIAKHKLQFNLKAIVNTHHHYDHSDGNGVFHKLYPDLPVIAGKDSPLVSYTPKDREVLSLSPTLSITALYTPCHTQDSICYFFEDSNTNEKAVFTGDTLFTSGCGRFFEGTGKEMNHALNGVLAKLPPTTKVFPGHEYTKSNLKFSSTILNNDAIKALTKFTNENEKTTGIFTIGDELKFNPFMMLKDPAVIKATGKTNEDDIMTALREMKNRG
ncbi:hydroxyacylglutathione hydrolase, cytoplasmic isozyme [[Candida] jaroonii]|uniref:Hydroxyacylglutathione hydrolase, cytoplasmic isozyme n=1 Tax=[Candida] jaroonii TaxID=467808 RepID=A0ACA9YC01_9ASCO|nr:hydroxyacylglutathione hydrolase, cytoplasmic isozyme [[Candida] jaroonii]